MIRSKHHPAKAVIYCRVSSERQVKEGDGLNSQETRCREFAKSKGYNVVKVFKDKGVSGGLLDRPAMHELFAFLDTRKESHVVIIDDVSRLARNIRVYAELTAAIFARKALLVSPTMEFGQSSEQELVGNMLASVAAFQRTANIEQVVNRQKARLIAGYWVFPAPVGYKYVKDVNGGKIMVRDEPVASVIAEAFEGFAAGRFENQMDVARFLEKSGPFPTDKKGQVHSSRVKDILTRILYTGYLEYPEWNVSLREGKHPAIINMQTFERTQEKLGKKAKTPARRDIHEDFPLRGFVLCSSCNHPLTASWSTGRSGKHPYYRCKTKGCNLSGKSIRRERVENDLEELLQDMKPSEGVLDLTRDVVMDSWRRKKSEYSVQLTELDREKKETDQRIQGFLGRLLETESRTMIKRYEDHIEALERERAMLSEHARHMMEVDTSFESAVGTVFDFVGDPYSLWANGDFEDKRLTLKLAFAGQMPFDRETGFGTTPFSLPFKVMSDLGDRNSGLVDITGESSNSFFDILTKWSQALLPYKSTLLAA